MEYSAPKHAIFFDFDEVSQNSFSHSGLKQLQLSYSDARMLTKLSFIPFTSSHRMLRARPLSSRSMRMRNLSPFLYTPF